MTEEVQLLLELYDMGMKNINTGIIEDEIELWCVSSNGYFKAKNKRFILALEELHMKISQWHQERSRE